MFNYLQFNGGTNATGIQRREDGFWLGKNFPEEIKLWKMAKASFPSLAIKKDKKKWREKYKKIPTTLRISHLTLKYINKLLIKIYYAH